MLGYGFENFCPSLSFLLSLASLAPLFPADQAKRLWSSELRRLAVLAGLSSKSGPSAVPPAKTRVYTDPMIFPLSVLYSPLDF